GSAGTGRTRGRRHVGACHPRLTLLPATPYERIVDTLSLSERGVSVPAPHLLSSDDVPGKKQGSAGVAFVRLSMPKTKCTRFSSRMSVALEL
ncbi:unnamed protein product, partial [Ectocarpus sp. 6 AP-2014]